MRRATSSSLLLALVLTLIASAVAASGGVRYMELRDAVRSATFVLVVEKVEPATEKHTVQIPYEKGGKPQLAKLETLFRRFKVVEVLAADARGRGTVTAESYLKPGTEHSVELAKAVPVGGVVRLLSSQTMTNQSLEVRALQDGTRKIALYRRLKDRISSEQLETDSRFLLLARYNPRYESLMGVGGSGLVSLGLKERVVQLLKRRGR